MLSKRKLILQLPFREFATRAGNAAGPPRRLCVGLLPGRACWNRPLVTPGGFATRGTPSSANSLPSSCQVGCLSGRFAGTPTRLVSSRRAPSSCFPCVTPARQTDIPASTREKPPQRHRTCSFLAGGCTPPWVPRGPPAVQPQGFPTAEVMAHCPRPRAAPQSPVSVVGVGVGVGTGEQASVQAAATAGTGLSLAPLPAGAECDPSGAGRTAGPALASGLLCCDALCHLHIRTCQTQASTRTTLNHRFHGPADHRTSQAFSFYFSNNLSVSSMFPEMLTYACLQYSPVHPFLELIFFFFAFKKFLIYEQ